MYAEDIEAGVDGAPSYAMLSEAARRLKITIVGGSIPERSGDHLYNTCCIFGRDGTLKGKHRKVRRMILMLATGYVNLLICLLEKLIVNL